LDELVPLAVRVVGGELVVTGLQLGQVGLAVGDDAVLALAGGGRAWVGRWGLDLGRLDLGRLDLRGIRGLGRRAGIRLDGWSRGAGRPLLALAGRGDGERG